MVNQWIESLKAWQMVGAAISWDASQLMMTSSASWDTMGVSYWCLQEHLLQNQPTQPSFAAR